MQLFRSNEAAFRRGRRAMGFTLVLALAGWGVSTGEAHADSLSDQQQRLNAAITQSQAALKSDAAMVSVTQTKLQSSQDKLAQQQQLLAQATAAMQAAQAEDVQLAAKLQAAQQALQEADAKVAAGKKALERQRQLTEVSLNQFVQQSNPLVNVALFTTNIGTSDLNQRAQWSKVALSVTQGQALQLASLQQQLEAAEQAQAQATQVAQQRKAESAQHLQGTQALKNEAAAAAEAVAATVQLNKAAAQNARAQQAAHEATKAQLVQQANVVAGKIAEAKRQAQIRAQQAAAAAAAAEAAAQRRAAEAANRSASAVSQAETVINTVNTSYSVPTSYTASSYSSVANYGGVDPWGFYWGQCVSYAAWKVRTTTSWTNFQNNYTVNGVSVHFGNANEWAAAAEALGITVNTQPTVGSIAWRASGYAGHVAYVTGVNGDGTINVSEYNYLVPGGFDTRSNIAWWNGDFDGFIHF